MEPIELPDELVSIRHTNTYKTPPDYFINLADEIISRINLPLAANTPFSAPPAEYFANFAEGVLSKIKNEEAIAQTEVEKELYNIEPLLTGISKANVYTVPQGYFDNFTVAVPEVKKPARIIQMRRSSKWFTSAAAAVVTGVIAVSIIFSSRDNSRDDILKPGNYYQTLSKVSDKEISNYLVTTSPEPDATLNLLEDNNAANDGNLKSLLNNVSDNELHDYLIKNDDVR